MSNFLRYVIKYRYQMERNVMPMSQMTLTDLEYSNRKKKTKREEFLNAMDEIIPWSYWVDMIRPYYFNNKRGCKLIGIETMLRMYLMQIWFNLSNEGIEDSIYDSYAMHTFTPICNSFKVNFFSAITIPSCSFP